MRHLLHRLYGNDWPYPVIGFIILPVAMFFGLYATEPAPVPATPEQPVFEGHESTWTGLHSFTLPPAPDAAAWLFVTTPSTGPHVIPLVVSDRGQETARLNPDKSCQTQDSDGGVTAYPAGDRLCRVLVTISEAYGYKFPDGGSP